MRKLVFLFLFGLGVKNSIAQEYIKEGRNRLNFAKTYLEIGGQFSPSFAGKRLLGNNTVQSFEHSASILPYLTIGGLHFWGHAEFYFQAPLAQFTANENDSTSFRYTPFVGTGGRFLPWAYRENRIRPFIGANWAIANFKQETKPTNNQPAFSKSSLSFDAGILYGKGSFMARLGVNFYPSNKWNYPVTENNFQQIQTPNWSTYIGIVYAFESTRSKNLETENQRLNKYPKVSKHRLNARKRGDYFIGIGPSSSFMLQNSTYNESVFPYFNKKAISNGFWDIAIGYHFNYAGIVTALSYRNPTFSNDGYGSTQRISKNSFALEAYKFLTDYSGFAPFLGINLTYDNTEYAERTNTQTKNLSFNDVTPGITIGWDILPGKTEQWFVLRTNLRWYPFSSINIDGKRFSQSQLEYNIIQAVFYPSRFKNARVKRNKSK